MGSKYGNCHLGKELFCYSLPIGTWFESNHQGSRGCLNLNFMEDDTCPSNYRPCDEHSGTASPFHMGQGILPMKYATLIMQFVFKNYGLETDLVSLKKTADHSLKIL